MGTYIFCVATLLLSPGLDTLLAWETFIKYSSRQAATMGNCCSSQSHDREDVEVDFSNATNAEDDSLHFVNAPYV